MLALSHSLPSMTSLTSLSVDSSDFGSSITGTEFLRSLSRAHTELFWVVTRIVNIALPASAHILFTQQRVRSMSALFWGRQYR